MRFCVGCGHPVPEGKPFCTGCGARQAPSEAPTAPAARPPVPRRPARRGPGWLLAVLVTALAALCGTAVTLLADHGPGPASHIALSGSRTRAPARATGTATPSTAPALTPSAAPSSAPSEQVAAGDLARLLADSVNDRAAIVAAVSDVNACGNTSGDARTFQQAARSRELLVTRLAVLRDRSMLPAQMLTDLAGAWQASYQADEDFAAWAGRENSHGCTPNDSTEPDYQAAAVPDAQATADKQAFVRGWNPIAAAYGLTTYQWNDL